MEISALPPALPSYVIKQVRNIRTLWEDDQMIIVIQKELTSAERFPARCYFYLQQYETLIPQAYER